MSEEEELYPNGVHNLISVTDPHYRIAFAVSKDTGDKVDTVVVVKDDHRICFVSTCGHGYFALAKKFGKFPAGLVIGEEDGGIDEEWQKALGWSSEYAP